MSNTSQQLPTLNFKRVCYNEASYKDLNRFICAAYGISEFNCVATEEWNNGSKQKIYVEKGNLSIYDLQKIEKVKNGKEPSFSLDSILTDLANRGLMEEGEYLINCYW